jgi:hypothetical protein
VRQDATWGAAAVIALAAAVGVSTQSAKPAGDSGRGSVTQSGARAQRPRATDKTGKACSDAEKMLQEFLLTQENSVAAPPVCFDDGKSPSSADSQDLTEKASHLKFVIATLPDPLHTHFSLLFDRSTEAIQEAAQDEDYEYDSSWLPWETEEQSFTHLKDQDEIDDRKDAREDQPGIIVFRNKKSPGSFEHGLVVFIVGEEATRGIHRRQFENAAAWINALQSSPTTPSPVSILGPTFSGSFKSLAQLMEDPVVQKSLNYSAAKSWTTEHVKIYSGSATDKSEV